MEKELKELYIEGLAIHGGPESCGGVREDAAEALTGVCAGRAIEPRKGRRSGCRRGSNTRKATSLGRFREPAADLAGSENLCMHAISPCARTGRSRGHPLVVMVGRVVRGRPRP